MDFTQFPKLKCSQFLRYSEPRTRTSLSPKVAKSVLFKYVLHFFSNQVLLTNSGSFLVNDKLNSPPLPRVGTSG